MAELPSKLYFRIGEVAGLVGVEPHVLRYWEREFRSIRPTKSAKGQRVYSRRDVENLLRVRDLLYRDGFTIAGAKKRMVSGGAEPAAASDAARAQPVVTGAERGELGSPALHPRAASEVARDAAAPRAAARPDPVREELLALRSEVVAFLASLDPESELDRR